MASADGSASPRPAFAPLNHAPAYKALSAEIERRILGGQLKPGEPLPSEQQLAEGFAVNRSTVREAIRQLEQEGLLVRGSSRRLHVALPGVEELTPRAARAMMLQKVTFRELWDVAVVVEPCASRLAAARASAAELAELEANVVATEAAIAAGEPFAELDVRFHALVARASRNRVLMLAREPVGLLYRPTIERLQARLPQTGRRNLEAHRRILEALRRGDAEEAELWTRRHLVDFQRGYRVAALDLESPALAPARTTARRRPARAMAS